MIIAVDFDGVICEEGCYPDVGKPNIRVINALIKLKREGTHLILWTCRTGDALAKAVTFCRNFGLEFDAVNENLPMMIEKYGNDCRKIYADGYLDDRVFTLEKLFGTEKKPDTAKRSVEKVQTVPSKARIVRK